MERRTFHWRDTAEAFAEVAGELGVDAALVLERERRWFDAPGGRRVHPALVVPIGAGVARASDYLADVPERIGRHAVLLLQAGAVSLGLFDDEDVLETKSFKRYVVRGNGKAQPTHLASKGKSRYGSRLRLQNARALLEETNERLARWWRESPPVERVIVGAPVRLLASLFEAEPPPPFAREDVVRIPRDLPRPTTEVLLRAQRSILYGRIETVE
ncbi:MAG: hypothetical protein R3F34_04545 [Planctomycetota bacterium]